MERLKTRRQFFFFFARKRNFSENFAMLIQDPLVISSGATSIVTFVFARDGIKF